MEKVVFSASYVSTRMKGQKGDGINGERKEGKVRSKEPVGSIKEQSTDKIKKENKKKKLDPTNSMDRMERADSHTARHTSKVYTSITQRTATLSLIQQQQHKCFLFPHFRFFLSFLAHYIISVGCHSKLRRLDF